MHIVEERGESGDWVTQRGYEPGLEGSNQLSCPARGRVNVLRERDMPSGFYLQGCATGNVNIQGSLARGLLAEYTGCFI